MKLMRFWMLLLLGGAAHAGTLTNLAMTPTVTTVGTTTSYTLTFRAPSVLNNTRVIRINNAAGGATGNTSYAGASLVSVSGGTLTMNVGLAVASELFLNITGGTAAANTLITISFNNITNPLALNGNGYFVQVEDFNTFNDIDTGTASGNTYTPNPAPVVVLAIPDQFGKEKQFGQYVAVNDLNTHFDDGDGDTLSFSIFSNSAPSVATPQISGNQLRITPNAFGTTTITVRASDNQEGVANDSFIVTALGFLSSPTVTPQDLITGHSGSYTITFNADSTIGTGDFITVSNPVGGPNHVSSSLVSLSGGLAGTRSGGGSTATVIQITSGSVAPGNPVVLVLGNLVNPGSAGTGPQYLIEKSDGLSIEDQARVAGSVYIVPPEVIFTNSFE